MIGTWRAAAHIARKDLRIELRTRDVFTAIALFALLIVVVASFSFPTAGQHREAVGAGLLWVAILFSTLLGVGRASALEHEEACIDGLVASPVPRESIYLGKVLSNLAFVGAAEALIVPVAVVLLQLEPGQGLGLLLLTVTLGTVALVAVSTLCSTMAVNTRTRETVLPLLVVPLAMPVMIAAVQATGTALAGGTPADASTWLLVLTAAAALFLLAGVTTFDHVLEE